jgi:hypothetical protein
LQSYETSDWLYFIGYARRGCFELQVNASKSTSAIATATADEANGCYAAFHARRDEHACPQ